MPSRPQDSPDRDFLPFVPEPLQARIIRYEPEDGDVLRGFYVIWKEKEGRRCRLCPRDHCSLEDVPETDTATCFRVLKGEQSDRLAVAFGLDPSSG